jgi:hypothetical protein
MIFDHEILDSEQSFAIAPMLGDGGGHSGGGVRQADTRCTGSGSQQA